MSLTTWSYWTWLRNPKVQAVLAKVERAIAVLRRIGGVGMLSISTTLVYSLPAAAAFSSVGSLANANNKTSSSSWSIATSAQLDQNNAGVLVIALDNQDTTDLSSNLCSSVSDVAGNDWVKAREFTNGQGAADAGATICIFYTKAKLNLSSGSNITVTLSAAKTAKAATAWEFSINPTNVLVVGAGADLANDALDAGSMTMSGLSSQEYLFVRGGAVESNGTSYTSSASYTNFTHTSATTAGGGAASNMGARGEFRVLTGTGDSTNPTTSASDQASTYIAISEAAPPAGGGPRRIFTSQASYPPRSNE